MEKQTEVKIYWAIGVLIIFIGLIYFFSLGRPSAKPLQVFTRPDGTTVSTYKNAPPGFPEEIILENKDLKSSAIIVNAAGKTQINVSYVSDRGVSALVDLYKNSLMSKGWKISANALNPKAGTVLAIKNPDSVLVTIVPQLLNQGTMVTFQYEK